MGCEGIDLPGGGVVIVCSRGRTKKEAAPAPARSGRVLVSGRVLYLGDKAVKLWTLIGDVWIPYSQILAAELAKLKEDEAARLTIPLWLAREKGLVE